MLTRPAITGFGPLIHVATASGLRQGELFEFGCQDADLAVGTLTVRFAMPRVD